MTDDDRTQAESETLPRQQFDEQQRIDDALERLYERQETCGELKRMLLPGKDWVKD